jgi:hypothetical protein
MRDKVLANQKVVRKLAVFENNCSDEREVYEIILLIRKTYQY